VKAKAIEIGAAPEPAARETPVFILAGGRGERLSGLTDRPKPLVEVAGQPFLVYLLASLKARGFRRVTLLTGYRAEAFDAWLAGASDRAAAEEPPGAPGPGTVRPPVPGPGVARSPDPAPDARARRILRGMEISLLGEESPLGTAGALRRVLPLVGGEALVMNGDSFCRTDYAALLRLRRARGGEICMAATRIADASDYGRLALDRRGRVRGFLAAGPPGPAWVNAGVYALSRGFLERALPAPVSSLEREVLPRWVEREPVWARRCRGYFGDIGTPERLAEAGERFPAAEILAEADPDPGRP